MKNGVDVSKGEGVDYYMCCLLCRSPTLVHSMCLPMILIIRH